MGQCRIGGCLRTAPHGVLLCFQPVSSNRILPRTVRKETISVVVSIRGFDQKQSISKEALLFLFKVLPMVVETDDENDTCDCV